MSFDPATALLDLANTALDKFFPDPLKAAEQKLRLMEIAQSGDLTRLDAEVKLLLAQIDVNKAEASHKSIFVAGARPFILWVGGLSLAWQFVAYPILLWAWATMQAAGYIPTSLPPPPVLDGAELMALVSALLGVAGMRSFDKSKGVETNKI